MFESTSHKSFDDIVRPVLPSQRAHWLLLLGSFFLFISHEARWLPLQYYPDRAASLFAMWTLSLPLMIAGAAGWYVALIPCERPARRLLSWVILPASISILVIATLAEMRIWIPIEPTTSIIETTIKRRVGLREIIHLFTAFGIGMQLAVAGLVFVLAFLLLLVGHRASVPIALGPNDESLDAVQDSDVSTLSHRKTMRFVWIMTALSMLPTLATWLAFLPVTFGRTQFSVAWISTCYSLVNSALLFVFVLIALGKEGRAGIQDYFSIPQTKYVLLGILLPAAVASVWPIVDFVHSRILWAHGLRGSFMPPELGNFFDAPTWGMLLYVPAALGEEIAWRGYLQPRFVNRYGLGRGVLLLGLVWGAFHFHFDFVGGSSWRWVSNRALIRIVGTVALSYPLAWLAIRSRSVLPATLFHAAHNASLHIDRVPFHGIQLLRAMLYLSLGYVLFRYFPPPSDEPAQEITQPSPTPPPEAAPFES